MTSKCEQASMAHAWRSCLSNSPVASIPAIIDSRSSRPRPASAAPSIASLTSSPVIFFAMSRTLSTLASRDSSPVMASTTFSTAVSTGAVSSCVIWMALTAATAIRIVLNISDIFCLVWFYYYRLLSEVSLRKGSVQSNYNLFKFKVRLN